ncbi:DUF4145 domain-containing protein [Pseudomonas fluorescens]|uniref:DUF4145 domain-containing protein n=1 Tax=Pseudomonas fluorescens TaxID=294 RepID=A0A7Z3C5N2_PSEFL|nr:DUF4145 domain-containing protein [Pseudomonas fluorescens]QJP95996.1 hypothetical protein C6Y56_15960 [Pseudomonas fluorescens]
MSGYSFENGKTNGCIHKAVCESCQIEQRHVVETSRRAKWKSDEFTAITEFEIIRCMNCDTISFRKESSNSEDYYYNPESEEYNSHYDVSLYPNRTAGRFKIEGNWYLPPDVRAAYEEVISAVNGGQPILAGLGVRVLIEVICRDQNAAGKSLLSKIDDLKTKGVLTVAGADILHKLRSMGNDSAHEAKPSSDKQISLAMDVVENLLQSVYIHPGEAKSAFK